MTLQNNAKYEAKLTGGLENDMRNLAQIFTRALESLKIVTLIGSFYLKQKRYQLKTDLCFQKGDEEFGKFHQSTLKCQNWDFHGIFYPKQKMYELKVYMGAMCQDNEK